MSGVCRAILRGAERLVEASSDFGCRAANWPVQRAAEDAWLVPVLEELRLRGPDMAHTLDQWPWGLLELGYGYGTLATAAMMLGWRVTALDRVLPPPAIQGVTWVTAVDIQVPGVLPRGPFLAVTMTEVLEHLNFHPLPLLRAIRERLAEGGVFIGSTPLPGAWPEPALYATGAVLPAWDPDAKWLDRHVVLYEPETVRALLQAAGFGRVLICGHGARYSWQAEA